ncbi:hypothetical protein AXF42_Ash014181 [Apostasia shenzhenica]|uniref:Uncharacterized protein n=1 Tax=Apostasia shenzhenica TaxID=1088818 RepID=A0A2I0A169_9ASPA|nr:hypothetical protein AXF42_Ash014181 [Apostasia shenzhenica]
MPPPGCTGAAAWLHWRRRFAGRIPRPPFRCLIRTRLPSAPHCRRRADAADPPHRRLRIAVSHPSASVLLPQAESRCFLPNFAPHRRRLAAP